MDFHEHSSFTLCLSVFSLCLSLSLFPSPSHHRQQSAYYDRQKRNDCQQQTRTIAASESFSRFTVEGICTWLQHFAVLRKKYRPHMESIYRQQTFAVVFVVRCTFMGFISLLNDITYFQQAIAAVLSSTFITSEYLHIMGLK